MPQARLHRLETALAFAFAFAPGLGLPGAASAAQITADGVACTLANAIRAANTDAPSGGCTAGSGGDIVLLTQDESIAPGEAAVAGSTLVGGGIAGLPDVTTDITIRASGAGDVIERQAGLPCDSTPGQAYRVLSVRGAAARLALEDVTVRNGCVAPTTGDARGGGILVDGSGLVLTRAVVEQNEARTAAGTSAVAVGGGLHGGGSGFIAITDSTIRDNVARGAAGVGSQGPSSIGGDAIGGGIAQGTGGLTIAGSAVSGNQALGGAAEGHGGAGEGGGVAIVDTCLATITGSRFTANRAAGGDGIGGQGTIGGPGSGGGLAATDTSQITLLSVTTFESNVAQGGLEGGFGGGGGMRIGSNAVLLERLLVRGNQALGGDGPGFAAGNSAGGGLEYGGSSFGILRNSWFTENVAQGGIGSNLGGDGDGAGLILIRDADELSGLTVSGNIARGGGGASGFAGMGEGGGLQLLFGTISAFTNNTFYANQALGAGADADAGARAQGGAIYDAGEILGVAHLTVVANAANAIGDNAQGGGLFIEDSGTFELADSILSGNTVAVTGNGTPAGDDCFTDASLLSLGYNHVGTASATCSFAAVGDVVGSNPLLGPFGDHGCAANRTLPGGGCVPTVGLLPTSLPLDAGSCVLSGLTVDERGLPRPVDLAAANAADGCDKGAFELQGGEVGVDLAILKTPPPGNPGVGQMVAYTVTVTNQSTLQGATGVAVSDPVPAGLSFVSSSCGALEGGGTVTWAIGALAAGAEVDCIFTFQRLAPIPIDNAATVAGSETDPDLTDNEDVASLGPTSVVEVPTLGEWGLALLALALFAAGIQRLRVAPSHHA